MSCPEWNEKAICRCGCQAGKLKRRFNPDLKASMLHGRPVGTWCMNWSAPEWLSSETQAIIDGHVPEDFDPVSKVLRPWAALEHWIGDRQVSAEEFERSCIEDEEKEKADLEQHIHESAEDLLNYINEEGSMREVQNLRFSFFGPLAACVLEQTK